MKIREVIEKIEKTASPDTQESWDNSGIQISVGSGDIRVVMTALEITDEVISEAVSRNVDLLITHHPLIFGSLKNIDKASVNGQYLIDLIKNNISVYSSHTPFDKMWGGNNDRIAEKLGLENTDGFTVFKNGVRTTDLIGRVGDLPSPAPFTDVADAVSKKLDISKSSMRTVGDAEEYISRVAICAGAGSDFVSTAIDNDCDLLITGDLKYHDAQNARSLGLCVIDAGHYGTEKSFAENMAEMLKERIRSGADIIISETDIDPFSKMYGI